MILIRSGLACAAVISSTAGLTTDLSNNAWRERPITKVIGLLKDMSMQLKKEADEDTDMYEKLTCWCTENDQEKTKAIELGNERIASLTASIEGYSAQSSQCETQIKTLSKKGEQLSSALEEATGIRSKEQAEFEAEEQESISTIGSLKSAVETMAKSQGGASLLQLQSKLQHHMRRNTGFLRQQHLSALALLQQQGALSRGSQPASGQIFGILSQMKESFEQNLASAQKDEAKAKEEFESLKAAKTAEIKATASLSDTKSVELADASDKKAMAKQDLKDTQAKLKADTEFLLNLKLKCQKADQEYEARQKMRMDEITAVAETIQILTNDEAQQTLSKSQTFMQTSFLQLRSTSGVRAMRARRESSMFREKAARLLQKTGVKLHSTQLVAFAAMTRAGVFDKIREKMTKLIAELKKTKIGEEKEKNTCQSQLKQNARDVKAKTTDKADSEQEIADLESLLGKLTDDIESAKAAIMSTQVEMKNADMNREAESKDFQVTVQDQRATQTILAKALQRLKEFYERKALLQSSEYQNPPEQAEYKKSGGASGVLAMLEHILNESKELEKKALEAENEANQAYETFVKDSNAAISALSKDIVSKKEAMAKADQEKVEYSEDLKQTVNDLLKLGEFAAALHQDCDWLLKNFDERQSALQEEIDALNGAMAILHG
eukprot:gnl/MRDRNA2_/MRDRNA2_101685_c0_seq1.p1 gnl/MRDRNA2_/MRDRNA2_101685_c0~~gnl/MRDRNA2_/MRDRNA2_101685_c0_seq1.p1  ORF type:complete len:668 (+),score=206.70 gnl/MRDRNA2_/MRDRNA2_101685_c0_seq1:66-2069(+)